MWCKSCVIILIFISVINCDDESPQVTTAQGILKGKIEKSRKERPFNSFTAIPYAKPPVGKLRFKPPEPAESWEGVLDATKDHPVCPQTNLFLMDHTLIGDEDCLYLNVYTPKLLTKVNDELLPVLFFIHGGGWFTGSGSKSFYGPKFLMDQDVVLVTINYRLGPLGFLTTGDPHVMGNNGLKDQALAIKWVKNNIANFGGDPHKLTLFGQSAGGASVHYHTVSPLTRDLINGAILQSGTALQLWAVTPYFLLTRRSKALGNALGCNSFDSEEMMECLRKVDAYEIVKATSIFVEWDLDPLMVFAPIVEVNVPGAYLIEDPIKTVKSGKAANIPIMTGLTTEEGALRATEIYGQSNLIKELDENYKKILPLMLSYGDVAIKMHREPATLKIREFYFGDKPIDESTKSEFIKMNSDATMLVGIDAAVELHSKFSKKPLYYYLFGYRGSKSWADNFSKNSDFDYGVAHCDDLLYLFDSDVFYGDYKPTETDNKMIDLMTTLWTNFAKYGNPTPDEDTKLDVKWKPAERNQQNYLYIKGPSQLELDVDLYKERRDFWRSLPLTGRQETIRDEL